MNWHGEISYDRGRVMQSPWAQQVCDECTSETRGKATPTPTRGGVGKHAGKTLLKVAEHRPV